MHSNHVSVTCSILKIAKLEQKYSEIVDVYTKDETLIFRNYVLALCRLMMPFGRIDRLKNEIAAPYINLCYKKSKVYRLALIIHASCRAIAENYESLWLAEAVEDCPHEYHYPNKLQCMLLALIFQQLFREEFNKLGC